MENYTTLKIIGTHKTYFDMLIYVPHGCINKDFLEHIRKTIQGSLDNISDESLYRYLYHEADTGVLEVISEIEKKLQNSDFCIGILSVDIPRGFCDLNRPINKAISPALKKDFWEELYRIAESDIRNNIKKANFVFQLHSMNSFDAIEESIFDHNIDSDFFDNHCKKVYSGSQRFCDLLTENEHGEYITNKTFDTILKNKFLEENIIVHENNTYRLLENYPCTEICHKKESSFFEIVKGDLATEETKNKIDTNEIIFDKEKIKKFGEIFSFIIKKYLQN